MKFKVLYTPLPEYTWARGYDFFMEGFYEVLYNMEPVGKVQVIHQGLYYRFHCRAQVADGRVCRLVAQWQDNWESLGILVPEGTGFSLDRKLPAKRMGTTAPIFRLIPSGEEIEKYLAPKTQIPEAEEACDSGTDQQQEQEPDEEAPAEVEESLLPGPEEEEGKSDFVPLDPEEEFDRMEDLERAVFSMREDQPGLLLPREEETEPEE